jgi:membrane protein insertase Oxa1/YidC/SpoIIIJ
MIDFFINIWTLGVYQPAYNLVVFTYNFTPGPSLAAAIIGIAILIRFAFLYFTLRSHAQDKILEKVKPQIDRIEEDKYLTAKEKYIKIAEITKPYGINPFFESIPVFVQLVFLIALYQILQFGINPSGYDNLYGFVNPPESINTSFFWFDMKDTFVLVPSLIVAGLMFIERTIEYNEKKAVGLQSLSQKWDPLILPAITFIILLFLPSAKAVFVGTSLTFSLAIMLIMRLSKTKIKEL